MKVDVEKRIQYLVTCPVEGCEEKVDLTHIIEEVLLRRESKMVGPWYCEGCGKGINWVASSVDDEVEVTCSISNEQKIKRLVLLDLDVESFDKPIQIVVYGNRWEPLDLLDIESQEDQDSYYYNEQTCPTNYLKYIEIIIEGDNADPHGIFKYRSAIDLDDELKSRICEIGLADQLIFEHNKGDWDQALCNMNAEQIRGLFDIKSKRGTL